jgi:hypothetical protein
VSRTGQGWAESALRVLVLKFHRTFKFVTTLESLPGDVAQLAEHLLCKQGVDGSIPFVSTSISQLDSCNCSVVQRCLAIARLVLSWLSPLDGVAVTGRNATISARTPAMILVRSPLKNPLTC